MTNNAYQWLTGPKAQQAYENLKLVHKERSENLAPPKCRKWVFKEGKQTECGKMTGYIIVDHPLTKEQRLIFYLANWPAAKWENKVLVTATICPTCEAKDAAKEAFKLGIPSFESYKSKNNKWEFDFFEDAIFRTPEELSEWEAVFRSTLLWCQKQASAKSEAIRNASREILSQEKEDNKLGIAKEPRFYRDKISIQKKAIQEEFKKGFEN